MKSYAFAAVAAAAALAAPALAQAPSLPVIWTSWSELQMRPLVGELNGQAGDLTSEDGGLHLQTTFAGGLPISVRGTECVGEGAQRRCANLMLTVRFDLNDTARARALEEMLEYHYVADMVTADGDLMLVRLTPLSAGVTRDHVKREITAFETVSRMAVGRIFPQPTPAATPAPTE